MWIDRWDDRHWSPAIGYQRSNGDICCWTNSKDSLRMIISPRSEDQASIQGYVKRWHWKECTWLDWPEGDQVKSREFDACSGAPILYRCAQMPPLQNTLMLFNKRLKGRVHHCTVDIGVQWLHVFWGVSAWEGSQPASHINQQNWLTNSPHASIIWSFYLELYFTKILIQKLLHMMSIVLLHPLSLIFHCRFQQHNLFNDKTPSSVTQNNVEFLKQGHHGWMQCRPIGGSEWMVGQDSRLEVF